MPIYEYTCSACHHEFEAIVHGGQVPPCPSCGGGELEKRYSVFARPFSTSPAPEMCMQGACDACPSGDPSTCGIH